MPGSSYIIIIKIKNSPVNYETDTSKKTNKSTGSFISNTGLFIFPVQPSLSAPRRQPQPVLTSMPSTSRQRPLPYSTPYLVTHILLH
jgi:hypothetical protein